MQQLLLTDLTIFADGGVVFTGMLFLLILVAHQDAEWWRRLSWILSAPN